MCIFFSQEEYLKNEVTEGEALPSVGTLCSHPQREKGRGKGNRKQNSNKIQELRLKEEKIGKPTPGIMGIW